MHRAKDPDLGCLGVGASPVCPHQPHRGHLTPLDEAPSLKITEHNGSGLHTWVLLEKFYTKHHKTSKLVPVISASVRWARHDGEGRRGWVCPPYMAPHTEMFVGPDLRSASWGQVPCKRFPNSSGNSFQFWPAQAPCPHAKPARRFGWCHWCHSAIQSAMDILHLTETRLCPDHLKLEPPLILFIINT